MDDDIKRHSAKIHEVGNGLMLHWCPGCKQLHPIATVAPNYSNAIWEFDHNYECPTFKPSINVVGRCHYFITAGKIMYCGDSKHALSGQTVDLPDIPEEEAW